MWRKLAIFVLSLPLLGLAIIWVPIGFGFVAISSPLWLMMTLIYMLRGDDPMWEIFLAPPLMMFSLYAGVTGLIPDPLD